MSEQDFVEIDMGGDAAFASLMDALAPQEEAPEDPGAGAAAAADAPAAAPGADSSDRAGAAPAADAAGGAVGGGVAAAGQPAGAEDGRDRGEAEGSPGAADGSDDGGAAEPAADGGAAAASGVGAIDASSIAPQLAQLSTGVEERMTKAFQATAYNEVREQHGKYFEALEKHPRLLVGQQVPSPTGEGMETLRDSADAKEWQEAVKTILVQEINERTVTRLEENRDMLETLHASVQIFQNNPDMIPGTKQFDKRLADQFAAMAKPYEVRVDGKLQGYSIPVQPIIDQLRQQLVPKPAPKAPPPAETSARTQAQSEPPQAAVPSKAANSGEPAEDFSTLFGTIGLPHLKI